MKTYYNIELLALSRYHLITIQATKKGFFHTYSKGLILECSLFYIA
jgi:hypothetical protein